MNVLLWHVHGSWTTAFVQGPHTYYFPILPDRGPDGRGRAETWDWPASAIERTPEQLRSTAIDAVIFQRLHEIELFERWTGMRAGVDVPALYLEHNTPQGPINAMRHPLCDLLRERAQHNETPARIPIVHVTHFNEVFWDCDNLPTYVVEHGIPDPGYRYRGDIPHAAVVINEPVRRWRVTGTDLLERFERAVPLDVFGMGTKELGGYDDVPQSRLFNVLAERRVYLHPNRWTSLGFSLIEAMSIGMPVVALATTEIAGVLPRDVAVTGTNIDALADELATLVADPARAKALGERSREYALTRFPLDRFLERWEILFDEAA